MDKVVCSESDVVAAFYRWVISERMGKTLALEKTAALSADDLAERCARTFLNRLADVQNEEGSETESHSVTEGADKMYAIVDK